MKEKLLALWAKLQAFALWLYSKSPFAAGVAVGYFCKPLLKAAVDLVAGLLRHLVG